MLDAQAVIALSCASFLLTLLSNYGVSLLVRYIHIWINHLCPFIEKSIKKSENPEIKLVRPKVEYWGLYSLISLT